MGTSRLIILKYDVQEKCKKTIHACCGLLRYGKGLEAEFTRPIASTCNPGLPFRLLSASPVQVSN